MFASSIVTVAMILYGSMTLETNRIQVIYMRVAPEKISVAHLAIHCQILATLPAVHSTWFFRCYDSRKEIRLPEHLYDPMFEKMIEHPDADGVLLAIAMTKAETRHQDPLLNLLIYDKRFSRDCLVNVTLAAKELTERLWVLGRMFQIKDVVEACKDNAEVAYILLNQLPTQGKDESRFSQRDRDSLGMALVHDRKKLRAFLKIHGPKSSPALLSKSAYARLSAILKDSDRTRP